MTERTLKTRLGLFLLISHFALLSLVIVLYFLDGFLFEDMTTTIALMIPLLGIYLTGIIKYFISNREVTEDKSKKLTSAYVFISFFLPSLLVIFLAAIILLKAYNKLEFEQFKILIATSETIFGVYMGLVLGSLFEIEKEQPKLERPVDGKTIPPVSTE